jgi:hypothetical protein
VRWALAWSFLDELAGAIHQLAEPLTGGVHDQQVGADRLNSFPNGLQAAA